MSRVLSVGQCGFDHASIARRFRKSFGAEVIGAGSIAESLRLLREGAFDLILVNRVLDGDGAEGLELVRALKGDAALMGIPVMLVSNYKEAQEAALAAGALRGFGKAEISSPDVERRIAAVLAPSIASPP